jgi:hypothetical protein
MAFTQSERDELMRLSVLTTLEPVRDFLVKSAAEAVSSSTSSAAVPAQPAPLPSASSSSSFISSASGSAAVTWHAPRHAWEQNDQHVTVLVMDLPPFLTKEAKEAVTCHFGSDSVELTVPPNIRLRLFPLEKDINVAESTYKVKKTQIEILLRKKEKWEHWGQLLSKSDKKSKDLLAKDPAAGLQDMMKTSEWLAWAGGAAAHHSPLSLSASPTPTPTPPYTCSVPGGRRQHQEDDCRGHDEVPEPLCSRWWWQRGLWRRRLWRRRPG